VQLTPVGKTRNYLISLCDILEMVELSSTRLGTELSDKRFSVKCLDESRTEAASEKLRVLCSPSSAEYKKKRMD
jgi:hypothetical protein